jgi:hypothetical protein
VPELERAKLPHVPNLAGSNRRDLQSDNQVHGRTLVSRLGSEARRWAKFRRTIQDGSSEPGCSRDQEQSCPTATTPIARATRAVRSNFAGRVMPNSAPNSMPNNSQSDILQYGGKITGFRESRWPTVQKVAAGDILLCYLAGVCRRNTLSRQNGHLRCGAAEPVLEKSRAGRERLIVYHQAEVTRINICDHLAWILRCT